MEGLATGKPKTIRRPAGMSDEEDFDDGDIIIAVEEDSWSRLDVTAIATAAITMAAAMTTVAAKIAVTMIGVK